MRTNPDAIIGIDLIGAPFGDGAGHPGTCMGPAALRVAGLAREIAGLGIEVRDLGDVVPASRAGAVDHPTMRNLAGVAGWSTALADTTQASLGEGRFPIVLGGDHSLSMGSIAGVASHWQNLGIPLFVLWIDAHADYNTPQTTPSGNVHGMSAALLCGEAGFPDALSDLGPRLPPGNLTILGARSIDHGERRLLATRGIDIVDMRRLDERGIAAALKGFLDGVATAGGVVHVSFDLDVLDPCVAPGTGTAVPGGLTYREAHLAMEVLHDSGAVRSLDVVELNPFLDDRGRSAVVAVEMVTSLLGRAIVERNGGMR